MAKSRVLRDLSICRDGFVAVLGALVEEESSGRRIKKTSKKSRRVKKAAVAGWAALGRLVGKKPRRLRTPK